MSNNKIMIVIAGLFVFGLFFKFWLDEKQVASDVVTGAVAPAKPVFHWVDIDGKDHATQEEAAISSAAARMLHRDQMDSIARMHNIKPRDIISYRDIYINDTGLVNALIDSLNRLKGKGIVVAGKTVDTVERSFEYADNYIWMRGLVGKKIVQVSYDLDDTLNLVTYSKKKWFLGRKRLYFDASLQNPNAYIRGMQGVKIAERLPGRFGIGPYIGIGTNGRPSAGLALTFSIIRF